VRKQYRALVAGRLDGPPGGGPIIIDHPVEGRPAHTEVRVASHSRCLRYGGWITTVDLVPRTGRRHQLRRHLAICLGHPILGDPLYTRWAGGAAGEAAAEAALMAAPPDELRARMQAADGGGGGGEGNEVELLKGWGMALWAGAIELEHPVTGEDMSWSLPEPARFEKLRAQQAARWEKFYGVGAVDGAPSSPERVSPSL
jgi:23S rRNA pseudouridine1911/1915/1917 synthase